MGQMATLTEGKSENKIVIEIVIVVTRSQLYLWSLGVCAFVGAFLLPTSDPDHVANVVLFCVVPLVACVGANYYYKAAAAKGVLRRFRKPSADVRAL